ncbi:hypothetical protein NLU13_6277 [Sarocladium strictum]|uniref:Uncharacterized protein n=1 Tax=Sarocladium strictum TaxID=5046 RepID=A0AA39GFK9_SARSR|nr:hypothetical protein NLU13_6277 [Sarocladium strictum]
MQFSLAAVVLGLAAIASAVPTTTSGFKVVVRQNQNRPVPQGACCVANTSLKQDACTTQNGSQGRCVPGGNNCGGTLSCIAQENLTCDANVIERGKSLCRAKAANGGLFDGARIIQSLSQASVN